MSSGEVRVDIEGAVAVVTIDHAEVKNALTDDMVAAFLEICDQVDRDSRVGVTVVRGANGTFCSGSDTRGWNGTVLSDEAFERNTMIYRLFMRVGGLATPTIAAVRGAAVGAGLNLVMAADLRIVAQDAKLIGGFNRVGLHPGGGFFHLLGRAGGREAAAALGVFGQRISGADAERIGLAWRAVADDQVEELALRLAGEAAQDPLLARQVVASLRTELGPPALPWEAAQDLERGRQMWSIGRK
jgi:enoyl-CoA hydratase